MSHIVHVVSIEHVPMREGSVSFQSKEVKGAQYSVYSITQTDTHKYMKIENETRI